MLSDPAVSVSSVLSELRITGLGVIDEAVIDLDPGFTVVTGETGAGKTMVVTALQLIGGGRGDAGRVRAGADRAVVEVRGSIDPGGAPATIVTAAGGRFDEDGTVIAVRSVGADGRSRAHLGGRSVPLAVLSEFAEPVLAVHGQSEAIRLLRPPEQRAVLDRFAGLTERLADYRRLRSGWQALVGEIVDRRQHARERAQREDLLRLGLSDIARVAPLPGEDAELVAEARRLEHADALRATAESALAALAGTEALADGPTAVGLVEQARRALDGSDDDAISALARQLREAGALLGAAAGDLASYLTALDADPARLDEVLTRQAALRGLTRRYGDNVDAVRTWAADAARELAGLDSSEQALADLQHRADQAAAELTVVASDLSGRRQLAAAELGARVTDELGHLAMARAAVRVEVTRRVTTANATDAIRVDGAWCTAGPDGVDQVELVLVAHPGAPALPIAKGASGGELSRVMLALEVVLAGADPVATMVFDEVDAGVGGRAATEIGRRLAMLAADHQVLVVTHLAQVAAFADRHVVVEPHADGSVGRSALRRVTGRARVAELARMLGGTDGATARAHASDLLNAAKAAV